ncbi:MAG: hypothetical protein V7646_6568 [Pseudonocardia sp.]
MIAGRGRGGVTAGYVVLGFPYGPIQRFVVTVSYAVARQRRARTAALVCAGVAMVIRVPGGAGLSRSVTTSPSSRSTSLAKC